MAIHSKGKEIGVVYFGKLILAKIYRGVSLVYTKDGSTGGDTGGEGGGDTEGETVSCFGSGAWLGSNAWVGSEAWV